MNKNFLIGLLFIAISIGFGVPAFGYNIGTLNNPGSGLFPLIVSAVLFIIGGVTIIQSQYGVKELVDIEFKNIVIITLALSCFALATQFINMSVGIVVLVSVASLSATTYSFPRVIKISIGLIAVASAFKYLLGLNLPLF